MDQYICSGCGNCSEVAPSIFKFTTEGVSVIHLDGQEMHEGDISTRTLDAGEIPAATQAANECPAEAIIVDSQ